MLSVQNVSEEEEVEMTAIEYYGLPLTKVIKTRYSNSSVEMWRSQPLASPFPLVF